MASAIRRIVFAEGGPSISAIICPLELYNEVQVLAKH